MDLLGLTFPQLMGVFGLFGAMTVGLYILKLRRRVVAVPFSLLWQRVLRDKEATSLFSQLKRLLSLLLQLALLFMLALALGDPRPKALFSKGRHIVLLIDASASMQATDVTPNALTSGARAKEHPDRLGVALDEAEKIIRSLGPSDRLLVAQMDAVVTPLGPMSDDKKALERSLLSVTASDSRADFPRALRFAIDTLRGDSDGEVVVVSDGNLGEARDSSGEVKLGELKLSFVPIGKTGRNVSITEFSVRRYPLDKNRYEVMFEVTNAGDRDEDLELTLLGDGKIVDLTRLKLRQGERLPRFYPNLSGASRTLEAKLTLANGEHDDLAVDDHAYALLPERHRLKVEVVSDGNTYLEAALLLDEYLDVVERTPVEYAQGKGKDEKVDAIIFDRVTPLEPPRTHALYIDPRGPGSPVKVEGEIDQPGFDKIDRKHPLVHFTALDDVNIARAHKLVPLPADRVVGASQGGPILVAGARNGHKFVAMSFDVRDSDLPLRVAWPVLLLNTINWFADEDASYISSFRTGDIWRIPVDGDVTSAALRRLPDAKALEVPVRDGRATVLGQRAGFYELDAARGLARVSPEKESGEPKAPKTEGATTGKTSFAANLIDFSEAQIAPKAELIAGGKKAEELHATGLTTSAPIWVALLLIVVAIAAIEWATYHRRVTV